jgi:hypothetical protein
MDLVHRLSGVDASGLEVDPIGRLYSAASKTAVASPPPMQGLATA